MRFLNAFAIIAALALSACGGEPLRTGPIDLRVLRSLENARLDPASTMTMLNDYRRSHGFQPVRRDPALMAMAQRQADAMVVANAMSHNANGSFASRLAAAGVNASEAGENLGGGYYSTEEAMTGWRNSPEHNANLLLPKATRFGIAIAKDPLTSYRIYWAMEVAADPLQAADGARMLMAPTEVRQ